MKTTIGGDRLGSGHKQEVSLKNYNRSSHDLSSTWRSSMAAGTLVPFMSEVALPADKWTIKLDADVKTLPTVGPLFGSYKLQLDVFQCPIRLYNGKLHMNMLNIGMNMSEVKLPQMEVRSGAYDSTKGDNQQVNPSSIHKYLGISGLGKSPSPRRRYFNAVPYLAYWDIYKQYYSNKQEEIGVVIHNDNNNNLFNATNVVLNVVGQQEYPLLGNTITVNIGGNDYRLSATLEWAANNEQFPFGKPDVSQMVCFINSEFGSVATVWRTIELTEVSTGTWSLEARNPVTNYTGTIDINVQVTSIANTVDPSDGEPTLFSFPLENIDDMRMDILADVKNNASFKIDRTKTAPYGLSLSEGANGHYITKNQEGLGIKTYQSDLANNWVSTEWIDGANGINEITAVDTTGDSFTIDSLNLANKVYNMLNRIAVSGGTYDDWLDAVYTHERAKAQENPVYQGSLIKEVAFEEVVSTTNANVQGEEQPMGTLAGRGRLTNKHKGGYVEVKVDEPSYIIGIVSLTPRLDYSQTNSWHLDLETLDDLHKPALDGIGYQDLITEHNMAWFDTDMTANYVSSKKSAGKQPAWINYMSALNKTYGNFAEKDKEMFMTLNRRYNHKEDNQGIADLTTYVDPSKFNYIFAETELSSQNFWVQISKNITARRKMSAKIIPNL